MRAIRRLERRFNKALANLDTAGVSVDTDAKIGKLSKEIATLEAWKLEQETVLDKATKDITAAQKDTDDMVQDKANLQTKIAELTASLEASAKSGEIAQNQLSELAAQKLAAEVALEQAQKSIGETSKAGGEIDSMAAKLTELEKANTDLHAALEIARKEQGSNEDASSASRELAALRAQREIDLAEVNVIIEKLTPLVEGK